MMKQITALLAMFTITLLVACSTLPTPHKEETVPCNREVYFPPQEETIPCNWEVYFSPHGGCSDAIIRELNKAKTVVLVQAYSFTSAPIAKALLDTHKRGIKVEVILDKRQRTDQYSSATFLSNAGIPVRIDAQHGQANNKIIIIDGETVMTGSFNFTKAAEENNAENLLVIHDMKLAELYTKNWQEHDRHSEVYIGKTEPNQIRVTPSKEGSTIKSKSSEYYGTVWNKIKEQWVVPENVRKESLGLVTVIVLKIDRNGKIKEMFYEKKSGNPQFDQTAWQAIKKAEPFPPIPKEVTDDTFMIGIRFYPE